MGGAPSPRIAQETLRRTPRICTRACRRVQVAQRLRSRASGANGWFCACSGVGSQWTLSSVQGGSFSWRRSYAVLRSRDEMEHSPP
jgi:hypothetical protein